MTIYFHLVSFFFFFFFNKFWIIVVSSNVLFWVDRHPLVIIHINPSGSLFWNKGPYAENWWILNLLWRRCFFLCKCWWASIPVILKLSIFCLDMPIGSSIVWSGSVYYISCPPLGTFLSPVLRPYRWLIFHFEEIINL